MQHVAKISSKEGELMEIRRDFYLDKLIKRKHILTGSIRFKVEGEIFAKNKIIFRLLVSKANI